MKLQGLFSCLLIAVSCRPTYCQKIHQGVVLDNQTNQPVSFATLKVKNKPQGAYCDEAGKYSLQAASSDTILISCVGYQSRRIVLQNDTVRLDPSVKIMDELVVKPNTRKKIVCGERNKPDRHWSSQIAFEYAVKIQLPDSQASYTINKIFFKFRGKPRQGEILQLHVYEATNELPGRELLIEKVFLDRKSTKGIDISSQNVICRGNVFVGVEWIGRIQRDVRSSLYLGTVFNKDNRTFSRTLLDPTYAWRANIYDKGPENIIAWIEVE